MLVKSSSLQFLAVACLFVATGASAQTEPGVAPRGVWLSAGLGAGMFVSRANDAAFSGEASLTYRFGANLIVVRGAGAAELFGSGAGDIGLLFGRARVQPHRRTSIAAGLAVVGGCRAASTGLLGGSCDRVPTSIGIPVEAQVAWVPLRELGLGLVAFADVSQHLSFVGAALSIQVGRLW
jgi:hypothetical protein